MVLTTCQILRIISFTVTQLPAPNYHCRAGEETAIREMPESWWGHIYVDVGRQATHGCGDLIFSSHTTFVLVGVLTFTEYGETLLIKIIAWIGVALMGLCIIASRKHYSVDVVVAWYTVPLVFYAMHRRWTTKRPMQDYWPHRPLAGEGEGTDANGGSVGVSDVTGSAGLGDGEAKPLLPVVTSLPLHSRTSSRSTTDLRSLGKPPLPPKEPASPPPGSSNGGFGGVDSDGGGVVAAVAGALRGARPQRRQSSISGSINGSTIPLEVEMRDLEAGNGGGGGSVNGNVGGGSSNQDSPPMQRNRTRDSSPGPVNPATPECSLM